MLQSKVRFPFRLYFEGASVDDASFEYLYFRLKIFTFRYFKGYENKTVESCSRKWILF